MLSDSQKQALLEIAREAVAVQVAGTPVPVSPSAIPLPGASGVFVTLKVRGELRGCLGTLDPRLDLGADVARCAADAASADPRFTPIGAAELPGVSVEVSVLGPLEPIDPAIPGAIEIGRHGLVAEQGSRRGLLLPQVAVEWGWTVDEFLRRTCLKAGLRADAWQHGATVSRFGAEVFGA